MLSDKVKVNDPLEGRGGVKDVARHESVALDSGVTPLERDGYTPPLVCHYSDGTVIRFEWYSWPNADSVPCYRVRSVDNARLGRG
jgi:hypothetical protein